MCAFPMSMQSIHKPLKILIYDIYHYKPIFHLPPGWGISFLFNFIHNLNWIEVTLLFLATSFLTMPTV